MASAKSKKVPKRRPKPAPAQPAASEDVAELSRLRDEVRARVKSRVVDEDDEDEDDDSDEGEAQFLTYDPRTHGLYSRETDMVLPREMGTALAQGDKHLKDIVAANSAAAARQQENMYTGFATNVNLASQQLQDAYAYSREQRDRGDRLQESLNAKNLEFAEMVKQSEDAKLERERLYAELRRAELANERFQKEIDGRLQQRQQELNAVVRASAPVFGAVGNAVGTLVTQYGGKFAAGMAGGLPQGPQSPQSPNVKPPEAEISLAGALEWRDQLVEALTLVKTPELPACLRAMLCSYALSEYGAPPLPSIVSKKLLGDLLVKDLGPDVAQALFMSCRDAYVVSAEEPVAYPVSPGAAPN